MSTSITYDDINSAFQYLDVKDRHLGIDGVIDIFNDMKYDTMV